MDADKVFGMPINPLSSIQQFPTKPLDESPPESRRQGSQNSGQRNKKNNLKSNAQGNLPNAHPMENEKDLDAIELNSQIIDSERVVELLAHRPKPALNRQKIFKAVSSLESNGQKTDTKKVNKTL